MTSLSFFLLFFVTRHQIILAVNLAGKKIVLCVHVEWKYKQKRVMDPIEVEFIGEDTTVGVIPNFSFEPIHLISGTIGPFRAGLCLFCLRSIRLSIL